MTASAAPPKGQPRARDDSRGHTPVADQLHGFLATAAGRALSKRPFGLRFWDGSELRAVDPGAPTIVIRDPAALAHLIREPNQLGMGRAWVNGLVDVEGDLDGLLALRRGFDGVSLSAADRLRAARLLWSIAGRSGLASPPLPESEATPAGRLHSRERDRSAVRHHYDVPEAFYRLVLGPSMVYSCAYFASEGDSLEQAQEGKLERICRKLRLRPGDRLLDIGCGWGSLAMHAARLHGVRAVGVTLSPEQARAARERITAAGLDDVCEIRVADYRDVTDGPYDAIASVGMYEHVGGNQLDNYAQRASALLRAGGLFLNHGIARLTPGPGHRRTFINRFVFPDGDLQPVTEILGALTRAGFEIRDLESLREHYVLTLRRWSANLNAHQEAAVRAGGPERERIWRLYMAGAAQAFQDGEISVFQTLALRPGAPHRLPLTRCRGLADQCTHSLR